MFTGFLDRSILVLLLVILVSLAILANLYRTHLFDKIDPDLKYHRSNIRGYSHFYRLKKNVPEEMIKVNSYTTKIFYFFCAAIVIVCILIINA